MKITKFNVNRSKSDFRFKTATYVSDGLMTSEDYIKLHSLEGMSGKNIQQINITGPDMSEINTKISETQNKLSVQNDKLNHLYYLTESQGYCGRVWDESSASPTAKTYCGNLEMLQNLPELLGLGGYLVQNDHTRRKLSSTNHYFFEDGSEAKLDGSMGHYQWGWSRPFYITIWRDNNLHYECISFEPIKGRESYYVPVGSMSASGHAAIDHDTNTLVSYCNDSPRYRGGINNAAYDNEDRTLLGRCGTILTVTQFIEASRKNGQGWYIGSMRINRVLQVLFHIIMGTRNSQADFNPVKNSDGLYSCGLGIGVVGYGVWRPWMIFNLNQPFLPMSECAELGDYTGVSETKEFSSKNDDGELVTQSYTIPIFFGLKNLYGYIWRYSEDDFNIYDNNSLTYTHYFRKSLLDDSYKYGIVNDSVKKGHVIAIENNDSAAEIYIKDLPYKNLELYPYILDDNATDSTYYCDGIVYYNLDTYTNTVKTTTYGGNFSFENPTGISTLCINRELQTISYHIGTPLCEFTEDFLLEPVTT